MITITPTAAAQILDAATRPELAGLALRIAAKRDAAGDIEYGMGFDELRENDAELQAAGVQLIVGAASRDLLTGTTLDFVEYLPGEFRFIFVPPAASGCSSGACSACSGRQGGC
ncbi:MAG: HesB/IscA family protein [Bacteroidota bacterium]